jgi:hypothetical protein
MLALGLVHLLLGPRHPALYGGLRLAQPRLLACSQQLWGGGVDVQVQAVDALVGAEGLRSAR